MPFSVTMKGPKSPPGLKAASRITARVMKVVVNSAVVLTREGMVGASPNVTGTLRASWIAKPAKKRGDFITGRVFSAQPYALVIDQGAHRHFPPVGKAPADPALGVWIRRRLGIRDPRRVRSVAFQIGRAINRRGFRPRLLFTRKWRALQRRISAMHRRGIAKIVEAIRGAG